LIVSAEKKLRTGNFTTEHTESSEPWSECPMNFDSTAENPLGERFVQPLGDLGVLGG
jgi:hypothetical protein